MRWEWTSELPEDVIRARIRRGTRPWSRADLWTARNTYFSRDIKGGDVRLVKTGAMRGYVFADIHIKALEEGGTRLSVTADVPRTLYAADIALCALFLLDLALTLYFRRGLLQSLRYLWVPGLFLWMTRMVRRQVPELARFIEENTLN